MLINDLHLDSKGVAHVVIVIVTTYIKSKIKEEHKRWHLARLGHLQRWTAFSTAIYLFWSIRNVVVGR
jgi:hypothetical protein